MLVNSSEWFVWCQLQSVSRRGQQNLNVLILFVCEDKQVDQDEDPKKKKKNWMWLCFAADGRNSARYRRFINTWHANINETWRKWAFFFFFPLLLEITANVLGFFSYNGKVSSRFKLHKISFVLFMLYTSKHISAHLFPPSPSDLYLKFVFFPPIFLSILYLKHFWT